MIDEKVYYNISIVYAYLVKTRHSNVTHNIISCCDNADCDFCIARCKSFCKHFINELKMFKSNIISYLINTYKHVFKRSLGKPAI